MVNSFVTPDSTITAYVYMSRFFLNNAAEFKNINDAEVNLWVNGTLKEKLTFDSVGMYTSTYKPKMTDSLKLTVDVPKMKQVSAKCNFVEAPIVLSVDTQKLDTFASQTKPQYPDFEFTDVVSGNTTDPLADESTSPVGILLSNSINRYHVFSDDVFNGKTYTLQFSTNITKYIKDEKDIYYGSLENVKHEIFISLQSISEDYYLYLQTHSASYATNLFSEPVKVHNNVDGGSGVFGSYTTSNIVMINLI